MKRLIEIITLIIIIFGLSSLVLYRTRLDRTAMPRPEYASRSVQTAIGEILTVDADNNTMVLTEGDRSLTLSLDEKTAISESGRPVRFGAISTGAKATVRYRRRGNRYWAEVIELMPQNSY